MELLRSLCGGDQLHYQLTRELLSAEHRYRTMLRRTGLFESIERSFERHFYVDEEDAVNRARHRRDAFTAIETHREDALPNEPTLFDLNEAEKNSGPA
jgi:DNA sulfur modification protein DndC